MKPDKRSARLAWVAGLQAGDEVALVTGRHVEIVRVLEAGDTWLVVPTISDRHGVRIPRETGQVRVGDRCTSMEIPTEQLRQAAQVWDAREELTLIRWGSVPDEVVRRIAALLRGDA